MYKEKYLLFTTKKGDYLTTDNVFDDHDWSEADAVIYPSYLFLGMKPKTATTIEMSFKDMKGRGVNIVTLNIKNGNHVKIMNVISAAVANSSQAIITIADTLGHVFIHKDLYGCTIKNSTPILYYEKIANATQVNIIPINTKLDKLTSMTLANIHSGDATVQVFLANSADNWYIIKDVVIPTGSTLKLEADELDYDGDIFNLYVKLGGTTPVDVIIR